MSKAADGFVSDEFLAGAARRLRLGSFLDLGNADHDRDHATVLARAFEALMGAIYLDQGLATSAEVCRRFLDPPS